jgi:hypothetical protein
MHDRQRQRDSRRTAFPLALLLLAAGPWSAAAVTLEVTTATVAQPGDTARLCVLLRTEGKTVAGTQNDLTWDASCATLADKDRCEANPSHGKGLNAAIPPGSPNTLRAFVLSLTDVDPIPDTELYCCSFTSKLSEQGTCCEVGISRAGASTPDGVAIETQGKGGRFCLGVAPAVAAPAAPPAPPPSGGIEPWVIGAVVLAAVVLAAVLLLRKRG